MDAATPTSSNRFLALLQPIQLELELYARRLLWEPQQAPDAVQNAVLRAFASFDRYVEQGRFRAWMFRILTREAWALNRKHGAIAQHEFQLEPRELAELPIAEPGSTSDPGDEILEPELENALRLLNDNERAVLLLRAIGEFRYREISDTLDMPLGSVMGHLARARVKMRLALRRLEISCPSRPST
jgi:RNA polymerase sigma-70 factor, ECF subfamily